MVPANVLLHVYVPGEPRPKGRPRHTRARLTDDGVLVQPHSFTPRETVEAEELWRWVMKLARTAGPVPGPVGMRMAFWTSGRRKADWDNLGKSISDAGQGVLYDNDEAVVHTVVTVHRGSFEVGTDLLCWRLAGPVLGERKPG